MALRCGPTKNPAARRAPRSFGTVVARPTAHVPEQRLDGGSDPRTRVPRFRPTLNALAALRALLRSLRRSCPEQEKEDTIHVSRSTRHASEPVRTSPALRAHRAPRAPRRSHAPTGRGERPASLAARAQARARGRRSPAGIVAIPGAGSIGIAVADVNDQVALIAPSDDTHGHGLSFQPGTVRFCVGPRLARGCRQAGARPRLQQGSRRTRH